MPNPFDEAWLEMMRNGMPMAARKARMNLANAAAAARAEPMPPPVLGINDIMAAPVVAKAAPKAPKVEVIPFTERSTRLPRFKMKYETAEEMQLRLASSIVMVRDEYVYVTAAGHYTCDFTGIQGLGINFRDKDGNNKYFVFATEGLDLRSPDPGYVTIENAVYYMTRPPARVYKQGLNPENTRWMHAALLSQKAVFNMHNISRILQGLNNRPVINWSEDLFVEGMRAVRLSDRVAVRRNGGKNECMYRGNPLGIIKNGVVKATNVSEWTRRALNRVGLEVVK